MMKYVLWCLYASLCCMMYIYTCLCSIVVCVIERCIISVSTPEKKTEPYAAIDDVWFGGPGDNIDTDGFSIPRCAWRQGIATGEDGPDIDVHSRTKESGYEQHQLWSVSIITRKSMYVFGSDKSNQQQWLLLSMFLI